MQYTKMYNILKNCFSFKETSISLPNLNAHIQMHSFTSTPKLNPFYHYNVKQEKLTSCADAHMEENNHFLYPIMVPDSIPEHKKWENAILLLHGLNERSWEKYLPWALSLCESTHRPVILFPISFHMNRAPIQWGNPRAMLPFLKQQKAQLGPLPNASFVNIALSQRLRNNPLRFYLSGEQSANDIIGLLTKIKVGDHPLFNENAQVDFFAYSIGAFLSQIIFLSNPGRLLDTSRLFMLCGGALFNLMDGNSRLIMDQGAFQKLKEIYVHHIDKSYHNLPSLASHLQKSSLGRAFMAMLNEKNMKTQREERFLKLQNRIHAVGMGKDHVIPATSIQQTLSLWNKNMDHTVEVIDPNYSYTHETPFPVTNAKISHIVDQSFDQIFCTAANFFNK